MFLPPYSPELQPCEHLWPLTNEAITNRRFETLDGLQEAQVERCIVLQDDPSSLRKHTLFHWWPTSCS
jgi:transposase